LGGFKGSSQHLDQEVLEWDVRQAGSQRRREAVDAVAWASMANREHRPRLWVAAQSKSSGSEPGCHVSARIDGLYQCERWRLCFLAGT
jgi:hypothetical protein